jgi:hypothetical protein
MLIYHGWRWRLARPGDARTVGVALDADAAVGVHLAGSHGARGRLARVSDGSALYLIAHDDAGASLGIAGLLPYDHPPGSVETSTLLARAAWGRGVNAPAKRLLWELALLLGHDQLALSTDARNARAIAAAAKLWPDADADTVWEERKQRHSVRLVLRRAPAGTSALSAARRAHLQGMLAERYPDGAPAALRGPRDIRGVSFDSRPRRV